MQAIQTYEDLIALIRDCHNPVLARKNGHVMQIWEDGEITRQRSGELLWLRPLDTLLGGIPRLCLPMPVSFRDGLHFYAFVSKSDAIFIGRAIARIVKQNPLIDPLDVQSYATGIEGKAQLFTPRKGAA